MKASPHDLTFGRVAGRTQTSATKSRDEFIVGARKCEAIANNTLESRGKIGDSFGYMCRKKDVDWLVPGEAKYLKMLGLEVGCGGWI